MANTAELRTFARDSGLMAIAAYALARLTEVSVAASRVAEGRRLGAAA